MKNYAEFNGQRWKGNVLELDSMGTTTRTGLGSEDATKERSPKSQSHTCSTRDGETFSSSLSPPDPHITQHFISTLYSAKARFINGVKWQIMYAILSFTFLWFPDNPLSSIESSSLMMTSISNFIGLPLHRKKSCGILRFANTWFANSYRWQ